MSRGIYKTIRKRKQLITLELPHKYRRVTDDATPVTEYLFGDIWIHGVWLKAIRSTDIISACTFEYPEQQNCQFYNDRSGLDSADWIKYYDKTPTEDTGPEGAKGGKYYMYIETSTMKSEGNARLMSSLLTTDKQLCLSFYYHMFGDSIGELQVIISIVGSNQIIFRKSNSQGNYWHYKELYFLPANNFKIIFNGIDGSGYMGDIALDHILLFSGNCNNYTISIGEPPVAGAVTVEEALMIIIAVTIITLQQLVTEFNLNGFNKFI
ncbi:MAM domain-containing glycosylphosphatidylinositol anchor protein 2-like [Mytilus trossulus]|uniref:MAM domain-containing glycosylphosphatidylinositol anchor protein 2-like n=1 Tax=Mytilus trossulus TaxID=6551 RepID=UPI003004DC9A